MSKKFVIVVDAQNDFMRANGALPVPDAESIIPSINQFLGKLRPEDISGVLFTFDTHRPEVYEGSEEGKMFPIHCVYATDGWELAVDPTVINQEIPIFELEKGVFDMWAENTTTVRDSAQRNLARDTFFANLMEKHGEQVLVLGVASEFCVKWAIQGLVDHGFIVGVNPELTRGIAQDMRQVVAENFVNRRVALVS